MIDIDFKFYRGILWKRLPLIIAIWLALSIAAIAVAYVLPPVYRSNARILVVKPQIDPNLATQTVNLTTAEIIQSIQERLLTRCMTRPVLMWLIWVDATIAHLRPRLLSCPSGLRNPLLRLM